MAQIGRDRAALIVIDMQNGFCHQDGSLAQSGADTQKCADAIPGCRRLIDGAHDAGVPVVYTQFELRADYADGGIIFTELLGGMDDTKALVKKTWDAQILDELEPEERDHVIYKNRFNGFHGTPLEQLLRSLHVETLVVCGVTTNMCVESTVRDAAERNYRCFVARDAVGEVHPEMHDAGLRVMEYAFAQLVDVDDVAAAWSSGAAVETGSVYDSPDFFRPGRGVSSPPAGR